MKSLIAFAASIGALCLVLWALGYHVVRQPTPDQLYGCSIQQQAPNGDCP